MMARVSLPLALALLGLATAAGCGSVAARDATGDGGGADALAGDDGGGDAGMDHALESAPEAPDLGVSDASDAPASEVAPSDGSGSSCPVEIAPCVAALQRLKAGCPGEGSACQVQTEASAGRINYCYDNGVRVYSDPGVFTVLKANERVCYTVTTDYANGIVTNAVLDPAGAPVITISKPMALDYESVTCGDRYVDIPDTQQPCGDMNTLPQNLQCITGTCNRP
jgi:hypothetical protein